MRAAWRASQRSMRRKSFHSAFTLHSHSRADSERVANPRRRCCGDVYFAAFRHPTRAVKATIIPVTPFQQNCSILVCEDTNKAAIVDPGGEVDRIVAALKKTGATPEKIFLTHGHIDHVGGTLELAHRLGLPIEGPHPDERFWIDQLPA